MFLKKPKLSNFHDEKADLNLISEIGKLHRIFEKRKHEAHAEKQSEKIRD
jgi:hypothetical protein